MRWLRGALSEKNGAFPVQKGRPNLRKVILIVVTLLVLSIARPHVRKLLELNRNKLVAAADLHVPAGVENGGKEHFSPAENLEQLDIEELRHARQTVDIAMYAFTDRRLAEVLNQLAVGTVKIRIYRDRGQYEEEEQKAALFHELSTTRMFRGHVNIAIRVKQGPERDLMHQKSYCVDHRVLRDGSANWSPNGEKSQDNNARFTSEPQQVKAFERNFEAMWSRSTNLVLQ